MSVTVSGAGGLDDATLSSVTDSIPNSPFVIWSVKMEMDLFNSFPLPAGPMSAEGCPFWLLWLIHQAPGEPPCSLVCSAVWFLQP